METITIKEYVRIGECIQCGDCCAYQDEVQKIVCRRLQYVGDKSFCDIYPYRPEVCKSYPVAPKNVNNPYTPKCGYKFVLKTK